MGLTYCGICKTKVIIFSSPMNIKHKLSSVHIPISLNTLSFKLLATKSNTLLKCRLEQI